MNLFKTGVLLTALTLLFVGVGHLLGGTQGAMMAFVVALLMNLGAYWFSDKIVLAMYHAKPLSAPEAPELFEVVGELSRKAGMPMPRVYLVPHPSPNAFATGRGPRHAVVAVTQGVLQLLSREELRGVLAHELAHVRNRDVLVMTLAATIAGAIAMLASWARWAVFLGNSRNRRGGGGLELVALLLMAILAPLAATIIQLAISRTREYSADASGARLLGTPSGLINALLKLEEYSRRMPLTGANPATAHLCIVNPLRGETFAALFSTHPPMARRIERLKALL